MGISLSKVLSWLVGPLSIFQNVVITGGQFTWARTINQFIQQPQRRGLKILSKRVVASAMHDSAQRVDPPRCHPNTRDAIIERIFQWIVESEHREEWLLWLNGAAGAGKSAIAQSITERCAKEKVAIASFFFSKTYPTRDNAAGLVATLVYQLIQKIPQIADDVLVIIEQDPLIFEKSLETQLKELIIDPLVHVHNLLGQLFILVIDGLDECKDKVVQHNLIQAITNLLRAGNLSVIFLIASRAEPDIVAAFKALGNTPNLLMKFPLDDIQQASDGIRNLLNDKFAELKETHPIGHQLPENWPSSLVIERIIAKSSGQFIYASLVVRSVSSPRHHPVKQLEIMDGILSPSTSKQPFADLDALYRAIFSQIEPDDLATALNVIAYILLTDENRVAVIDWAFQLSPGEVEISLSYLAAVITCSGDTIRFLHASLSDFLLDRNRSREYHINAEEYTNKLTFMVLSRNPTAQAHLSIIRFFTMVKPSADVHRALLQYIPKLEYLQKDSSHESFMFSILIAVKNLTFDNQAVYRHFLDLVMKRLENKSITIRGLRKIFVIQEEKQKLERGNVLHDLLSRLDGAGITVTNEPINAIASLRAKFEKLVEESNPLRS